MTRLLKGAAALAASLFTTAALAGSSVVQGDGKLVQSQRSVSGFTRVELRLSIDAVVREGSGSSVEIKVDSNLANLIKTEVKGDALVISSADTIKPHREAKITVTLPDFRGAGVLGSGDMEVSGVSGRKDLDLAVAGSGDLKYRGPAANLQGGVSGSGDLNIHLEGEADQVELGLSGSGDVRIVGGTARELIVGVSGSGDINATALTARSGRFATSGSGDIEATLDGGEASFAVAGSGDITWHGEANVTSQAKFGSGSIQHRR
jgi:hypothetical protein